MTKKKAGRPPVFSAKGLDALASINPGKSRRTNQNLAYVAVATRALGISHSGDDHDFTWLFCHATHKVKTSILVELGRLRYHGHCDADEIKQIARNICEEQPLVKDIVKRLRDWRTGKETTETDANDIADYLMAKLNDFIDTHDMSWQTVLDGIETLHWRVSETATEKR